MLMNLPRLRQGLLEERRALHDLEWFVQDDLGPAAAARLGSASAAALPGCRGVKTGRWHVRCFTAGDGAAVGHDPHPFHLARGSGTVAWKIHAPGAAKPHEAPVPPAQSELHVGARGGLAHGTEPLAIVAVDVLIEGAVGVAAVKDAAARIEDAHDQ